MLGHLTLQQGDANKTVDFGGGEELFDVIYDCSVFGVTSIYHIPMLFKLMS